MKYLDKLFEEKKPLKTTFATKRGKPHQMASGSERKEFGKLVGKRSKAQHRKTVTGFVKKYGNERPVVPGESSTNKIPIDVKDHAEYRRIGALMAEALGLTPEQMKNRKYYADAMRDPKSSLAQKKKQAERLEKERERRRTDPSMPSKGTMGRRDDNDGLGKKRMDMEEAFYFELGMLIAEAAREAYIDKESQDEVKAKRPDGGFAGPMARGVSKPGGRGTGGAATTDRFVKSSIRRGGEAIKKAAKKKLGVDVNPEKIETKNLAQVGKQINKKSAKKKGLGLPRETPEIAKADRAEDIKKRAGKPEQSRRFPRRR